MSIKISLYKLRELRYDVEISPSNYLCIGRYYARLICSGTGVYTPQDETRVPLHISLAYYPPIHR